MGLEAVGFDRVAAVVVNRDRQEMVLDVRPREALVRADEAARLELVAGAGAGADEQPFRPDGRLVVPFQRRVQRDRLGAFILQVHLQVILEIGADAGDIGHLGDAQLVQQRGGAKAGALEDGGETRWRPRRPALPGGHAP